MKKDENALEDDDSESISTSERSHMFFKERKEKLRVQIDKKFKEDAEMHMIAENEEESEDK